MCEQTYISSRVHLDLVPFDPWERSFLPSHTPGQDKWLGKSWMDGWVGGSMEWWRNYSYDLCKRFYLIVQLFRSTGQSVSWNCLFECRTLIIFNFVIASFYSVNTDVDIYKLKELLICYLRNDCFIMLSLSESKLMYNIFFFL